MVPPERKLLLLAVLFAVLLSEGTTILVSTPEKDLKLVNPAKLKKYVDELQDMPRVQGFKVVNGFPRPKLLKIGMFDILWKFHRDLPPTPVFAYGTSRTTATVPGPTIEALHGVDTYVTWLNHLPPEHIFPVDETIMPTPKLPHKRGIPTVVHLHGGLTEPESDGNSESWFTAGFKEKGPKWTKRTYHYNNHQHPGNLWYHDHAMGLNRLNFLAGLVGAYVIRDPKVEDPLQLPAGDEFDHSLLVFDRSFRLDGSIYINATGNNREIHPNWQPEYFGDVIIVNGKAWPYMRVRRRKYRFRIINASNARFFRFFFNNGLQFIHIGTDSAYLRKRVFSNNTLVAPSEIIDVVVDFSKSTSDTVILENDAPYPYPSGDLVNDTNSNSKVMKFIIAKETELDTWHVPKKLIKYPVPDISSAVKTRYIAMYEYVSKIDEPTHLYFNAKPFSAPVTETPKPGTTEIWNIINLTEDNHPFHMHLGLFAVLKQTKLRGLKKFSDCMNKINDAKRCRISEHAIGNKRKVLAYEKGWKNVYKMHPGFVTKILVKFSFIHSNSSYPFDVTAEPGYAYHCHILDHEDNVMMRPLKFIN